MDQRSIDCKLDEKEDRTQANRDHKPMLVASEKPAVDDVTIDGLLQNGVALSAGDDADLLLAQAKVGA